MLVLQLNFKNYQIFVRFRYGKTRKCTLIKNVPFITNSFSLSGYPGVSMRGDVIISRNRRVLTSRNAVFMSSSSNGHSCPHPTKQSIESTNRY